MAWRGRGPWPTRPRTRCFWPSPGSIRGALRRLDRDRRDHVRHDRSAYSFGEREGPPMLAQGHAPQITAGVVAFIAALAALLDRPTRRPSGSRSTSSRPRSVTPRPARLTGRSAGRSCGWASTVSSPTYPCSPYRAADGWVGVTCLTPAQWASLCRLIERPDLAADRAVRDRIPAPDDRRGGRCGAGVAFRRGRRTNGWRWAWRIAHPDRADAAPWRAARRRRTGAIAARSAPVGDGRRSGPTLPFRLTFEGGDAGPLGGGPLGPAGRRAGRRLQHGLGRPALRAGTSATSAPTC